MGLGLCKRCDSGLCIDRGIVGAGGELHLGACRVGLDGKIWGLCLPLPAEPWPCFSSERALGYLT